MGSDSTQVLVAVFDREKKAELGLNYLKDLRKEGIVDFYDAAILTKDRDGKLHVKETGDISTGKGAGIGSLLGGVLGLVAGPAGVVIGASTGAVIGGLAAHGDAGHQDEQLAQLGEKLEPGMSALVAIISEDYLSRVDQALADEAIEVSTHALDGELLSELDAGDESAAKKVDVE